jgi:hypothetical protein
MTFYRAVSSTDGAVMGSTIRIRKLYWNAPGATAGSAAVKNGSGTVIATLSAPLSSANADVQADFGEEGLLCTGGMQVTTLAAGTLYVYIM